VKGDARGMHVYTYFILRSSCIYYLILFSIKCNKYDTSCISPIREARELREHTTDNGWQIAFAYDRSSERDYTLDLARESPGESGRVRESPGESGMADSSA
jgi:hypothetical protein